MSRGGRTLAHHPSTRFFSAHILRTHVAAPLAVSQGKLPEGPEAYLEGYRTDRHVVRLDVFGALPPQQTSQSSEYYDQCLENQIFGVTEARGLQE